MSQGSSVALASVSRRLGAYLIDVCVSLTVTTAGYALALAGLMAGSGPASLVGVVVAFLILLGYPVAYLRAQGRSGATPGKLACGIRTVDADAYGPIGFGRALVRQLVLGVLGPINIVQLVTIPASPRRQGWHDSAARSIVVPVGVLHRTPNGAAAVDGVAPARPGPRPAEPWPAPSVADLASASPAAPTSNLPLDAPSTPAPVPVVPPPPGVVAPPPGLAVDPGQTPVPTGPAGPVVAPPPGLPLRTPTPTDDRTGQARPTASTTSWALATSSARKTLQGPVLVGRDPNVELVTGATAWNVDDPGLSVSKTHALFGVDSEGPWIEDWHSTNGTVLRRAGEIIPLAPHDRTGLRVGDLVDLGDLTISVTKDPA